MIAKLISSSGEYLDAVIEVNGLQLHVMDEFSGDSYKPGDLVDVELCPFIDNPGSWEDIFSSNPEHKIGLESLGGWQYMAFGEIISVSPVRCDCGISVFESPFHSNDSRCIGEFVGFKIQRLDAWPA